MRFAIRRFTLLFLSLLVGLGLTAGCGWIDTASPPLTTDKPGTSPTASPDPKFQQFEQSRAACGSTSECKLMPVGGCDNVQAIHLSQIDLARAYTVYAKNTYRNVQCAPGLPIEDYEPLCLNRRCLAAPRNYRLLLEAPELPQVGEPFWIGMGFRFPQDSQQVSASFLLPESLRILQGQLSWSGPLHANVDHVMWVQVLAKTPGELYISGRAAIQDAGNSTPPVDMSVYVTVAANPLSTLQPSRERILVTPTLASQ